MTEEEVKEILYNKDAKWEGDNALQGLKILEKYAGGKEVITGAEHDEIYSIDIDEALKNGLTRGDVESLAKLNWSTQYGYFYCFV